jgi:hypothetical protein
LAGVGKILIGTINQKKKKFVRKNPNQHTEVIFSLINQDEEIYTFFLFTPINKSYDMFNMI